MLGQLVASAAAAPREWRMPAPRLDSRLHRLEQNSGRFHA